MKYTWLRFLDYNLVKDYKALFPRLQSKKKNKKKEKKIMHYPTKQYLDSEVRLQNREVLGTHFAQTELALLDLK